MNEAEDNLSRALGLLILEHPFFATIAVALEIREDKDHRLPFPTMGTDGIRLWYRKEFVESIEPNDLMAVLCHEVLHIALKHPFRREYREPIRWNIAADHCINLMLKSCGMTLPSKVGDVPCDPQYEGLNAEQVYNKLPRKASHKCFSGCQKGKHDHSQDQDGAGQGPRCIVDAGRTAQELAEAEAVADLLVEQAKQVAKMQGKLPGDLEKILDGLKVSRVDYRRVLPQFIMTAISKDDFNWSRPNRRALGLGLILPGLYNLTYGHVGVGFDSSGSVWSAAGAFLAEFNGVLSQLRPRETSIAVCDTQVVHAETFQQNSYPIRNLKYGGGGGTDFRPLFEHFERLNPDCLIFLTDTYGTMPDRAPRFPVLWVIVGSGGDVPFGIKCYLNIDGE